MFKQIKVKNIVNLKGDLEVNLGANLGLDSSLNASFGRNLEASLNADSSSNVKITQILEDFYEDTQITLQLLDSSGANCVNITFICLEVDLMHLITGFLASVDIVQILELKRQNDTITAHINLTKEAILSHLKQKEIIQTCESIQISDIKSTNENLIVPFNGSKTQIKASEILQYARFFDTHKKENSAIKICQIIKNNKIVESCDTNAKNAIYKVTSKANLEFGDLLDSMLIMSWTLDLEVLKKILRSKITFIMFSGTPSFYVLKYAQKFGLTLLESKPCGTISILTHQIRVKEG